MLSNMDAHQISRVPFERCPLHAVRLRMGLAGFGQGWKAVHHQDPQRCAPRRRGQDTSADLRCVGGERTQTEIRLQFSCTQSSPPSSLPRSKPFSLTHPPPQTSSYTFPLLSPGHRLNFPSCAPSCSMPTTLITATAARTSSRPSLTSWWTGTLCLSAMRQPPRHKNFGYPLGRRMRRIELIERIVQF